MYTRSPKTEIGQPCPLNSNLLLQMKELVVIKSDIAG